VRDAEQRRFWCDLRGAAISVDNRRNGHVETLFPIMLLSLTAGIDL
jgi:hypothetical protein